MHEMFEVISKVVLLLVLFLIAWSDYKTQLLDVKQLLVGGVAGLLFCRDWELLCYAVHGGIVGVLILFVAWWTRESIGYGDGWLFVVTGLFLGFIQNLTLLFGSLILAGIFAIVSLVLKRRRRNDSMALGPFVLMSYVMFVL